MKKNQLPTVKPKLIGTKRFIKTANAARKTYMNDLSPFEHGQEGTHSACMAQVMKYGGKVKCCQCFNHSCQSKVYGVTPEAREELGEKDHFKLIAWSILILLVAVIAMMILPWRT